MIRGKFGVMPERSRQHAQAVCKRIPPTCSSKSVSLGKLPHPCEKLGKSSTCDSHTDDNVGSVDVADAGIVEREDEGRRRE